MIKDNKPIYITLKYLNKQWQIFVGMCFVFYAAWVGNLLEHNAGINIVLMIINIMCIALTGILFFMLHSTHYIQIFRLEQNRIRIFLRFSWNTIKLEHINRVELDMKTFQVKILFQHESIHNNQVEECTFTLLNIAKNYQKYQHIFRYLINNTDAEFCTEIKGFLRLSSHEIDRLLDDYRATESFQVSRYYMANLQKILPRIERNYY